MPVTCMHWLCVLVMLKGDHQVYDPSVAFPYEPHYALIAHIQNGKLPNMLPLMSAEAAGFVKRCFPLPRGLFLFMNCWKTHGSPIASRFCSSSCVKNE